MLGTILLWGAPSRCEHSRARAPLFLSAFSSCLPSTGIGGWPGSRPPALPAEPAAPWASPSCLSTLRWRSRGGAWGNLHPARGCQSPCASSHRGFPAMPAPAVSTASPGYRTRRGAMPGPIKLAGGIKVSRMQLCPAGFNKAREKASPARVHGSLGLMPWEALPSRSVSSQAHPSVGSDRVNATRAASLAPERKPLGANRL